MLEAAPIPDVSELAARGSVPAITAGAAEFAAAMKQAAAELFASSSTAGAVPLATINPLEGTPATVAEQVVAPLEEESSTQSSPETEALLALTASPIPVPAPQQSSQKSDAESVGPVNVQTPSSSLGSVLAVNLHSAATAAPREIPMPDPKAAPSSVSPGAQPEVASAALPSGHIAHESLGPQEPRAADIERGILPARVPAVSPSEVKSNLALPFPTLPIPASGPLATAPTPANVLPSRLRDPEDQSPAPLAPALSATPSARKNSSALASPDEAATRARAEANLAAPNTAESESSPSVAPLANAGSSAAGDGSPPDSASNLVSHAHAVPILRTDQREQSASAQRDSGVGPSPTHHSTDALSDTGLPRLEQIGKYEMRVSISDADFGFVGLRARLGNEALHAQIRADRAEVAQALSQGLPRLEVALASQEIRVERLEVRAEPSNAAAGYGPYSGGQEHRHAPDLWQRALTPRESFVDAAQCEHERLDAPGPPRLSLHV